MGKFIKKLLFIFLFSSISLLSYAQITKFDDGKFVCSDRDVLSLYITHNEKPDVFNYKVKYYSSRGKADRDVTYKQSFSNENLYFRFANQEIKDGNDYWRFYIIPEKNIIICYSLEDKEGSIKDRIVIKTIIAKKKKEIKGIDPNSFKELVIKVENTYIKNKTYKQSLLNGDQSLANGNFYAAIENYTDALTIKPNDSYATAQIQKAKEQQKTALEQQKIKLEQEKIKREKDADASRDKHEIPSGFTKRNSRLEAEILKSLVRFPDRPNRVKDFWKYYKKNESQDFVKVTYTKVLFYSYEWTIIRNEFTGIITGKSLGIVLIGTTEKGDCIYTQTYYAYKPYNGSSYGKLQTKSTKNGWPDPYYINCDKIK